MLSRIAQTFVSVGVTLALLVITMELALAAPAQSQPKPSDFFWAEVAAGTLGAALGLSLSAWVAYGCPAGIADLLGNTSICNSPGGADTLTWLSGLSFGIPVGATLGVIFMGSYNGVQSPSIIAATIGAYLGTFVGFIVGGTWISVMAGAAVFAAYSYNQGAKMKPDKSKAAALSWQLPLVTIRF